MCNRNSVIRGFREGDLNEVKRWEISKVRKRISTCECQKWQVDKMP